MLLNGTATVRLCFKSENQATAVQQLKDNERMSFRTLCHHTMRQEAKLPAQLKNHTHSPAKG